MTHKRRLSTAGYYIIGILIAVISLIPFAWMISTSLKARGALMSIPIEWIPKEPTLAAYEKVLTKFPFLKTVANSLFISVSYKEDIIADMLLLKQSLTDTTGIDEKEQMISEEMTFVAGLIEKHVKKNAVVAQNQEEYMARYNELVDRYEGLQKQLNAVNVERTGRMTKSHAIDEYVRELSSAEAFSMSFNGKRWNAMVDRVNVYKDGRLVFRFAGGQEITVNIWD